MEEKYVFYNRNDNVIKLLTKKNLFDPWSNIIFTEFIFVCKKWNLKDFIWKEVI